MTQLQHDSRQALKASIIPIPSPVSRNYNFRINWPHAREPEAEAAEPSEVWCSLFWKQKHWCHNVKWRNKNLTVVIS